MNQLIQFAALSNSFRRRPLFQAALTYGLSNPIIIRWKVIHDCNGKSYIQYPLPNTNTRPKIEGFNGHEYVWLAIFEESGKIVASFYPDLDSLNNKTNHLKKVVLSEFNQAVNKWVPLGKAKVIQCDAGNLVQHQRAFVQRLQDHLLHDQEQAFDIPDLPPKNWTTCN
ncbi:MAG: hypothetical protein ABIH50_02715 [bacterium]